MQKEMTNKKIYLVTGAASGIGAAVARYLTARGNNVCACDIDECIQNELQDYYQLDITDTGAIGKVVEIISEKHKHLDGIVNCAGIVRAGPLVELESREIHEIFAVNLFGMYEVTKACFPLLLKAKGRIVNISSLSGKIAFPFMGPYAMSKHAVEAFSDSLRRELSPLGIKVSIIEPGKIMTPLIAKGKKIAEEKLHTVSPLFRERGLRFAAYDAQRAEKNALPPETVAEKVYHALVSPSPRDRYLILKNRLKTKIMMHLPAKILDNKFLKL